MMVDGDTRWSDVLNGNDNDVEGDDNEEDDDQKNADFTVNF